MTKIQWLESTKPFFTGILRHTDNALQEDTRLQLRIESVEGVTDICQELFPPKPQGLRSLDIVRFYLDRTVRTSPI